MIEITVTEIVLFCWAVLATGFALQQSDKYKTANRFIVLLIENPEVIEQIREAEKQFNEGKI